MFGKSKDGRTESGVTLIATNCELEGDVHFSDQLVVNGIVKGGIYAQSGSKAIVTISEKGRVKGDIKVPNVIVNGKVFGDIHSDRHIELAAKAEVKGNVYYNLIEMVRGSKIDGNLVHIKEGKQVATTVDESVTGTKDADVKQDVKQKEPDARPKEVDAKKAATVAAVKTKTG